MALLGGDRLSLALHFFHRLFCLRIAQVHPDFAHSLDRVLGSLGFGYLSVCVAIRINFLDFLINVSDNTVKSEFCHVTY